MQVSVILPVRNESGNLEQVIETISGLPLLNKKLIEILAIDDYSSDDSFKVLTKLTKTYKKLRVVKKTGEIGKGAAIIEACKKAKGDVFVVMDADGSYDAKAIPDILLAIERGGDLAVGDRYITRGKGSLTSGFDRFSMKLFGRTILNIHCDFQSGLKAFTREVFEHFTFEPSQWSFDLELLSRASHAGFRIICIPVTVKKRTTGEDSLNVWQALTEYAMMTLKLTFIKLKPVRIRESAINSQEIGYQRKRFKPYTTLHHKESAIRTITWAQFTFLVALIFIFLLGLVINWNITLIVFMAFLALLYFADLSFYIFLIVNSLRKNPELTVSKEEIKEFGTNWPKYTIICPLYNEWEVVPQFVEAMQKMDYPKNKLQVIISLEEDDKKTQEETKKMKLPDYFEVVVTPHSLPKTKPKACNYALSKTTGEYVVIYDAEDIPEVDQLKKAVVAFKKNEKDNVICIQSKLNFYNTHQNLLTRFFSMEYSLWFDLVLTGLHSIDAPIPLGGTSNHFKKESLSLLQGWDPFNVTEDCDLGIRLFKYGYKTKILDSTTWEEANASFFGWFPQRARWIKGYIQTYLVHMRRPHDLVSDFGNWHILTFQLVVGGKVLSMWINPFLWLITISYFAFRPQIGELIESMYIAPVFYIGVVCLVFGNFFYFYNYMIGAAKRKQWDLIKFGYLVPFYWLMMSVASWQALYNIIVKPHHWAKTKHGAHLNTKFSANAAIAVGGAS